MNLFPKDRVAGVFRGFNEGGLEFHADLVLPYRNEYQNTPMHGQFLLVQLESENEAVLGRITSMAAQGQLASGAGEDFGLRAVDDDRVIPEDLRRQYLKYRVAIRVLGVVKAPNAHIEFVPSQRRLPHVGSKVAFLSDDALRQLAGHTEEGAELGFFALGEYVYHGDDGRAELQPGMQTKYPTVIPRFNQKHLVARRSFVFARAGYGKSNLVKLLFSNLYKQTPEVEKRAGRKVPVGTVIFDPDGEYFWPDDKGRPGLCDVPELEDKLVVFTNRKGPSAFYRSFVAGGIKLDIRRLRPADVIAIALSPDRQDQQNVRKLKSMNTESWAKFVDEIYREGNNASPDVLRPLLRLEDGQDAELYAARANMTQIVNMLHDPSSMMLDMLLAALSGGKLCVVDVSQMRGTPALVLSGLVLSKIFNHNQEQFTRAMPQTIPTIAVIEEAQSVLGQDGSSGDGPYVSWVKEGRKYDLGAVLITQQPGSIPNELLSQGDNWFIFHLLSAGDLYAVKKANAHFSDDILSSLLNEPIVGQGVFWSSVQSKPYPVPLRVMSFEKLVATRDPEYQLPAAQTAALRLAVDFAASLDDAEVVRAPAQTEAVAEQTEPYGATEEHPPAEPVDVRETQVRVAIQALQDDAPLVQRLRGEGATWWEVQRTLLDALPKVMSREERSDFAYSIMRRALDTVLEDGWRTEKARRPQGDGDTTWVRPE